jgi:hypothetical protein
MRRSRLLVLAAVLGLAVFLPSQAAATTDNDESAVYQYHMEVANTSAAASGGTATVTGSGTFSVHPKTATGGGAFTLTQPAVSGTCAALDTLAFQPYGCGVLFGEPITPNFCGGMLKMRVLLTPTSPAGLQPLEGILTIVCIIGDVPGQYFKSNLATEGIELLIPSVGNYDRQLAGMNVFIFTAGEPG